LTIGTKQKLKHENKISSRRGIDGYLPLPLLTPVGMLKGWNVGIWTNSKARAISYR